MPQDVGDEDDDDGAQYAMDEAGERRVLPGDVHEVDTPAPGEYRGRADDQERPHTALEAHRDDAGWTITDLRRCGRLKQVPDGAPDHAVG